MEYNIDVVSDDGLNPTLKVIFPPPPINPNTRININGNIKLNTIADGLLKIAFKLAQVMANIALT
jgi:hypothetical protein